MGDEQDRHLVFMVEVGDRAHQFFLGLRVQAGRGFIQNDEVRLVQEGLGQVGPLLLPAGSLPHPGVRQALQVGLLQNMVDLVLNLLALPKRRV